ncbi:MAG: PilZ domain-containing protein [Deltaproteobacteria bacterium]|nr:PilZ domain-containing protein [Deltaproteobacteria bacterium]
MTEPACLSFLAVGVNPSAFKFDSSGSLDVAGWFFLGVAGLAVVVFLYARLSKWSERRKVLGGQSHTKVKMTVQDIDMDPKDREMVETIAGSKAPQDLLPLLQSRIEFEKAVDRFVKKSPDHLVTDYISHLRQKLGYGFDNPRTPFNHSRMVAEGSKMSCMIPLPRKTVSYITQLINTNEECFYILPPKQKGKPVSLAKFATLTFKVTRQTDAEYTFTCNVLGQNRDEIGAVKLAHTAEIRKLHYREAPRIPVNLTTQFFVIKQDKATAHPASYYRAEESKYSFQGRFMDISLGGIALMAPPGDFPVQAGDVLVFHLFEANIKENVISRVLKSETIEGGGMKIHGKLTGIREINRLKLSKYLQSVQDVPPPPPPAAGQ